MIVIIANLLISYNYSEYQIRHGQSLTY